MKNLILISILFFSSHAFSASTPYPQFARPVPPVGVKMTLNKVSDHTYYVEGVAGVATDNEGFISNAGFVVTSEGVVVIDSLGTPSLSWKFLQLIKTVTDKPIVKVIATHYHADHIYGLQTFKGPGVVFYAPNGVYEYLDSDAAAERLDERRFSLDPWVNDDTILVTPDVLISSETDITVGDVDFRINYLGAAHSDGDLTVYVKQDKVLFSGDIIFEGRVPYLGDSDTKSWLKTLQELETNSLLALIPGHGSAANKPTETVSGTREYLAFIRSTMGKAVEELDDFATAYDEADWSQFSSLPAFEDANRRNAYQVFLSMEAEALAE